jgi:agmatine deiminase
MNDTPKDLGYRFPAEWEKQQSTWLTFPQNTETWPNEQLANAQKSYYQLIKEIAKGQKVNLLVNDLATESQVKIHLDKINTSLANVHFHQIQSNDAWLRDSGPSFLINPEAEAKKIIINWQYNAWGGKYPPFEADNQIPERIAEMLNIPIFTVPIVMEGGSVEFNGQGTLLTTRHCLLNPNRNPHLTQSQIEQYLYDYYAVSQVLWLGDGIVGDDTDGHIDDIVRFINADTVITVVEQNPNDDNYTILQENLAELKTLRLPNDKPLNIIELPMPKPFYVFGERMPASYANFLITNQSIIVPTFECDEDEQAILILEKCFPSREVVGIDSREIIWGLGSFHCLSQQEPAI